MASHKNPVGGDHHHARHSGLSDEEVRQWFARDPRTEIKAHICRVIRKIIAMGVLKVDDFLPSVKRLAELLDIYPSAVGYAYAELTKEGIVRGECGRGIFVADPLPAQRWLANEALSNVITYCRHVGVDESEIERSFRSQVLATFGKRKK